MKYLLVLAVVFVAIWVWRHNRRSELDEVRRNAPPPKQATPVVMVACTRCGTHLPQGDAVQGRRGAYCSHEHRQQIEGNGA